VPSPKTSIHNRDGKICHRPIAPAVDLPVAGIRNHAGHQENFDDCLRKSTFAPDGEE
jgi:hypothetical protein